VLKIGDKHEDYRVGVETHPIAHPLIFSLNEPLVPVLEVECKHVEALVLYRVRVE